MMQKYEEKPIIDESEYVFFAVLQKNTIFAGNNNI